MKGNSLPLTVVAFFLTLLILLSACSSATEKTKTATPPAAASGTDKGKTIFYTRCASCHKVNGELTGPALKGAESRWPDKEKLYAFIRNSQEVIQKDKYARELWLKYNQTVMLPQPDLTDDEIRSVLDYINSVSEN